MGTLKLNFLILYSFGIMMWLIWETSHPLGMEIIIPLLISSYLHKLNYVTKTNLLQTNLMCSMHSQHPNIWPVTGVLYKYVNVGNSWFLRSKLNCNNISGCGWQSWVVILEMIRFIWCANCSQLHFKLSHLKWSYTK